MRIGSGVSIWNRWNGDAYAYSIIRCIHAAATQEINCQDSFKAMHSLAWRLSIHWSALNEQKYSKSLYNELVIQRGWRRCDDKFEFKQLLKDTFRLPLRTIQEMKTKVQINNPIARSDAL